MFSTSENYWSGQRLNTPEAVNLPAGFVDDLVAGFQIVVLQMAFQIAAHRPLGNGAVAIVLAPHLIDGIQMLWDSSCGGAVRRAHYKLDYRSQILIERHMAACMDCRCVLPMRCRPTWEDLAAMFEGSTASGAERAYKKAVQKLTQLLIEDGLFHTVVLKRKRQKKRKEKIAAATYLYQADSDGD